jgi:SHS2 domain-containing protein
MKEFEYLKDLTSDIAFNAYGRTLEEVFVNSAKAISSIMCNIENIKPLNKIKISLNSRNTKNLLYDWLQNIIAEVDIQGMFFCKFEIINISEKKINAYLYGENIDQSNQETVIKAVTNYLFDLKEIYDENNNKIFQSTICVDI